MEVTSLLAVRNRTADNARRIGNTSATRSRVPGGTSARVVIVNEEPIHSPVSSEPRRPRWANIWKLVGLSLEIVGVVGDVKSYLDQAVPPTTFIPASQASFGTSQLFEGWFPLVVARTQKIVPPGTFFPILHRSMRWAIERAPLFVNVILGGQAMVGALMGHRDMSKLFQSPASVEHSRRCLPRTQGKCAWSQLESP
jgi:hypothetical protein